MKRFMNGRPPPVLLARSARDGFVRSWAALTIGEKRMCRNIKILFNFDPPVSEEEIRAAALQFVRKVSGFNKPSKANEPAFDAAVEAISTVSRNLLDSLQTSALPRNREEEAARARARAVLRFSK